MIQLCVKTVIEPRRDYFNGVEWEDLSTQAEQAQKPRKEHELGEEQHSLRALAVLWGKDSLELVTHYQWELRFPDSQRSRHVLLACICLKLIPGELPHSRARLQLEE